MDNCMLPEILFNILVWLPVVSLLRFRSVCKTWCDIIDSSYFINQHLLRQEDDNSNGSLILSGREVAEWFLLSGHQFEERLNLDLSIHLPLHDVHMCNYDEDTTWSPLSLVASCNGIICLSCDRPTGRLRVALWNPATKNLACLPEPENFYRESDSTVVATVVAFGYAVDADDYKVVRVVDFINPDCSPAYTRVEVYSLQIDSWRKVDIDLPAGASAITSLTIYSNGYCCWLLRERYTSTGNNFILSLDLSREVFETIQLPGVLYTRIFELHLTMMSDLIACIDSLESLDGFGLQAGQFDIWVMTEYGVKESWTKLYMIRLISPNETHTFVKPEVFSKKGKFFLVVNWIQESRYQLAMIDPKTQVLTNLHVQFYDVAIYKESLVSVKKMVHLTRAKKLEVAGPTKLETLTMTDEFGAVNPKVVEDPKVEE